MASPKSPNQSHINIHNFFPPYPPPPSSYPQPATSASSPSSTAVFFPYQHATVHPQSLHPYPTSPLHADAGPQILALINSNNSNVKQQAPADVCSKVAKGRRLSGEYVAYDVDERIEGEKEPQQLEVTPITKYGSDPELVIGRQIAVNKRYICYGLKAGNIRVLNLNTASRSLFRGHTKRVADMTFFSDDVHVLASVSLDGRVFVWKVYEGPDEEDKLQITGNLVIAIQFLQEGKTEFVHPRLCWHCSNQDVLVVGIGNCVLRIDTTKVGEGEACSAEAPLRCSFDKLIGGVYLIGKHDGHVTDLSMCQWKTTSHLVSASSDGTIKIWEENKAVPLVVLIPHSGQPVNSAAFFASPHQAGHVLLITGGPLNREVKIWASASEEGLALPDRAELWKCTQTLELKSSVEPRAEEAFFNQVVALSQAGVLLIANAKKNAIYALHIEYGANPVASCMDYIAEFAVTMPILSFTGTIDPPGDQTIKVYCVQTLAIQQYALDLCQCLPPTIDHVGLERSDSTVSHGTDNAERFPSVDLNGGKSSGFTFPRSTSKPAVTVGYAETAAAMRYPLRSTSLEVSTSREMMTSNMESGPISLARTTSDSNVVSVASPPPPLSPRLVSKLSGFRDAASSSELLSKLSDVPNLDNSAKHEEKKVELNDISRVLSSPVMFKHPTHLITPSEILMAVSPAENTNNIVEGKNDEEVNIQDVVNPRIDAKVVGETKGLSNELGFQGEPQNNVSRNNDVLEEVQAVGGRGVTQPSSSSEAELHGAANDMDGSVFTATPQSVGPSAKGQKQKEEKSQALDQSSPSPNAPNIANSSTEPGDFLSRIESMQDTLNQLMTMQKDWQNQMSSTVAFAVAREGRRQEVSLPYDFEKIVKANSDALWARFQEESAKNEKLARGRSQQLTSLISNLINKDLAALLEKVVKKELTACLPAAVRSVTPSIEKAAYSAVVESFQRCVSDKAVNQLERSLNSRLEATVGRQIQAQFQTSGKQALQDALRSSFETSLVPAFEKSCKVMFDQVDATFQKGMIEHTAATPQHIESIHSQLALALRDSINSVSSMAQTLSGQLADSQRNLLNLAAVGANPVAVNPLLSQLSNGPLRGLHEKVEAPLDPTKELLRLASEQKYEEAFTAALQRSDVTTVSWLCSQVDLHGILSTVPLPLSQGVLLSLLQQLACDIHNDTLRKLGWLTDVAAAINPADQMIAIHVRPIFEQVFQRLNHHRSSPTITGPELSSIRLLIHVINSMLMTCK